jgi:hypothetical protein
MLMEKKKNRYEKPVFEHLDVVGQGVSPDTCESGSQASGACFPSGANASGSCSVGTSGF